MRKTSAILFGVMMFPSLALTAPSVPLRNAMKQIEQHRFEEAAKDLKGNFSSLDSRQHGLAFMTLGMVYLRNSEFHRSLYEASLDSHREYFQSLGKERGERSSRYVNLYLGEVYLESGEYKTAIKYLEKFIADNNVDKDQRDIAKINLGIAYFGEKNTTKAKGLWGEVKSNDPGVVSELMYAMAVSGSDKYLSQLDKLLVNQNQKHDGRVITNIVRSMVRTGRIDDAETYIHSIDLDSAAYVESTGKSKSINFYDVGLLSALSDLYAILSINYFEKAKQDQKYLAAANYYLGEAQLNYGKAQESSKSIASAIQQGGLPKPLLDRAEIKQAESQYLGGKRGEATQSLDKIALKNRNDPEILAQTTISCVKIKIDCANVIRQAEQAAKEGQGRRFVSLNYALGSYKLQKNKNEEALQYLEAARDKSNKNKIESNDVLLLVNLAEGYRKIKSFSENLEIYFEMSKQFPAVRQIQEAVQGTYSMEHKSAGDVKIF